MSGFDSFIAIDLETTGLDPAKCEIIELGAVHFENGVLIDSFCELVKPSVPIPREITRLTGISNAMVTAAPAIADVFEKYQDYIDKAAWIVGHNVSFDIGFLKYHYCRDFKSTVYPRLPIICKLSGNVRIGRVMIV
jgi:DNA polymerase III epsilon subunit family exonuclease